MLENVFNQSIWGDEGFSAILSMKSLPEILEIISRDTSPPLWNIFEHLAFQAFGVSEITIRGLSFTFFLGAIFFTYKIGTLLWNRKVGLLSAVLTFLNPFFFTYAFEGRMYSILALGVTASMYFFLRIIRSDKKVKRLDFWGYIISVLWAMYSHHFAIFAIFLQGLWFIYEFLFGNRLGAKKLFRAFIFIGFGYLPWLIPLYNQTKMVGGGFWLGKPSLDDLLALIFSYLAVGITTHPFQIPLVRLTLYGLALIVVLVVIFLRRWGKQFKDTFFLICWFLVPILVTWSVSQFFQSIFFNRYLLYTIPAAMLLVSSNLRKPISYILIAITIVCFSAIDYHYFTNPTKLPFRDLGSYVHQTKKEGDFLINWNSSAHHLWETKFYGFPSPIYLPKRGDLPFFVGTALMEENDLVYEISENAKRVGVTTTGPIEEINLPGYNESEVKSYGDLKFIWYDKTNVKSY